VLLVAGGEGSRLGLSGPKGCFAFGPVSADSLYQKHAEKVLALSRRTGKLVPFVLMTSPSTHEPTVAFFEERGFFGLEQSQVRFFQQETVPTTDVNGQLLLKNKSTLLENPNGHGGAIDGLHTSGVFAWLKQCEISDIVYLQVDNVLAPAYDPYAVGLRTVESADVITKVVSKITPEEKMGALVRVDGTDAIIEYSDLTPADKLLKAPDGSFLFGWGNVAAHVFSVAFLERLISQKIHLPYHQAIKDVEAWNGIDRAKIQGIKRERFIFDVISLGKNIGLEIDRAQEFAPLKNATGADSIESSRILTTNEFRRWFSLCGIEINDTVPIEIRPTFADSVEALAERVKGDPELRKLAQRKTSILL
jgi:UDP-N-acetylglucosamine/UDP-N-acetylgalactosamine diphosphorylase